MAVMLINPNSNTATTEAMCRIVARVLPEKPIGWTAHEAPSLIATPDALDAAALGVEQVPVPRGTTAVIVAAFGDPGAQALARKAPCPVVGIGAAAARTAGMNGTRFAVATTTPALEGRIDTLMRQASRNGRYLGCYLTNGDPLALMADRVKLDHALLLAVRRAAADGAECVIIGGGPLGSAAERLSDIAPVPLVNPVRAAAQEILNLRT